MARTSDETLSTRSGRPFALARYISPSSSSRTGQKSLSKASRLENITGSPFPEDAVQYSNERLTKGGSSVPDLLPIGAESEPRRGRRLQQDRSVSGGRGCARVRSFRLLRGTGLDHRQTERRLATAGRLLPGRRPRSWQDQFAAMKIARPKPVRWCSA